MCHDEYDQKVYKHPACATMDVTGKSMNFWHERQTATLINELTEASDCDVYKLDA